MIRRVAFAALQLQLHFNCRHRHACRAPVNIGPRARGGGGGGTCVCGGVTVTRAVDRHCPADQTDHQPIWPALAEQGQKRPLVHGMRNIIVCKHPVANSQRDQNLAQSKRSNDPVQQHEHAQPCPSLHVQARSKSAMVGIRTGHE